MYTSVKCISERPVKIQLNEPESIHDRYKGAYIRAKNAEINKANQRMI